MLQARLTFHLVLLLVAFFISSITAPSTDPVYKLTPGPKGGPTEAANKTRSGISATDVAGVIRIVANVVATVAMFG